MLFRSEKNLFFKVAELLLIFCGLVLSYKRIAVIAFALVVLFCVYRFLKTARSSNQKALRGIVGGLAFVVLGAILARNILLDNKSFDWIERFSLLTETGGSGRLDLWKSFFVDMSQSTTLEFLLGHGAGLWKYHNDFLQVFYNFGVVGFLLFVAFCVTLVLL